MVKTKNWAKHVEDAPTFLENRDILSIRLKWKKKKITDLIS